MLGFLAPRDLKFVLRKAVNNEQKKPQSNQSGRKLPDGFDWIIHNAKTIKIDHHCVSKRGCYELCFVVAQTLLFLRGGVEAARRL